MIIVAGACGIAAGTPLAILGAIGRAARAGAIIKGGLYLEQLGQVDTVVLDKTGTLTFGQPEVRALLPAAGVGSDGSCSIPPHRPSCARSIRWARRSLRMRGRRDVRSSSRSDSATRPAAASMRLLAGERRAGRQSRAHARPRHRRSGGSAGRSPEAIRGLRGARRHVARRDRHRRYACGPKRGRDQGASTRMGIETCY